MTPTLPRILLWTLFLYSLWGWSARREVEAREPENSLPKFWLSDDLEEGFARARRTERPLLIVFRCPP